MVPLSHVGVDILQAVPRLSDEYVFPVGNGKPIIGWSQARARLEKIIAASGAQLAHFTRHDLRRTCATNLGRLGTSEFIIGRVLAHASRTITGQVYNMYEYLPERRAALEKWAAYLQSLTQPPAANVLLMRAS